MSNQNTDTPLFPNITPSAAKTIVEVAKFLKGSTYYLDHKACKYPQPVKKALRDLSKLSAPVNVSADDLAEIDISKESKVLYHSLKTTLNSVDKMETNEKVQIFRTATALMEKLLSLQEKAVALDQYVQFKDAVMNALDRYLNPVQISEFIEGLEKQSQK